MKHNSIICLFCNQSTQVYDRFGYHCDRCDIRYTLDPQVKEVESALISSDDPVALILFKPKLYLKVYKSFSSLLATLRPDITLESDEVIDILPNIKNRLKQLYNFL